MKCKNCGAPIDVTSAVGGVVECRHCYSKFTIAKSTDKDALMFLAMGEHELDTCKFDDALASFEKASKVDAKEPEAFYGMALATAKVQYIRDYTTDPVRMQPICHDVSGKKFSEDKNYKKALSLATPEQKEEYKRKAEDIDRISEQFHRLKEDGLGYDCFICVKVSDDEKILPDGSKARTPDYKDADDIYFDLKGKGYRPFFSEREIRNKTGADYEAVILYALYTSKCMLVVCSNEEYLQKPWVKNEYTRYLEMMDDGVKEPESITIAFRDRVVERIPGIKGKIQGINLAKLGAGETVENFVTRFLAIDVPELQRKEYTATVAKRSAVRQGVQKRTLATAKGGKELSVSDKAVLKTISDLMRAGNFYNAVNVCDKMLSGNPSSGEAYYLRFLAENECVDEDAWVKSKKPAENFDSLEKAIACTKEQTRRTEMSNMLFNRVMKGAEIPVFEEYIVLPDSSEENIALLADAMCKQALKEGNTELFDAAVKTITNTDKYIKLNADFAHKMPDRIAEPYYRNILSVDEGNAEALYWVFAQEHGGEKGIFDFACQTDNLSAVEDKLFSYGFNDIAAKRLMEHCVQNVPARTEDAVRLFDFILTMIPKSEDRLFSDSVTAFLAVLMRNKELRAAPKYNEMLLNADQFNDNAYFNRVLIKNGFFNPLQLVKIADDLMTDNDYFSALQAYAEKHPDDDNIYVQINTALGELKPVLGEEDCYEYAVNALYVSKEKLPYCKNDLCKNLLAQARDSLDTVLHKRNCGSIDDAYALTRDIVTNANGEKDPDLLRAYAYAAGAQDADLSQRIKKLIDTQGTRARNNAANAEKRKRDAEQREKERRDREHREFLRQKREAAKERFRSFMYVLPAILGIVLPAVGLLTFHTSYKIMLLATAGVLVGYGLLMLILAKASDWENSPPACFTLSGLAGVAVIILSALYPEKFLIAYKGPKVSMWSFAVLTIAAMATFYGCTKGYDGEGFTSTRCATMAVAGVLGFQIALFLRGVIPNFFVKIPLIRLFAFLPPIEWIGMGLRQIICILPAVGLVYFATACYTDY